MNELHTFQDSKKNFTFTVKGEFLTKCPNPEEYDSYDLITKFGLPAYIHNPSGPAVHLHHLGPEGLEYWINGKQLSKEEGAKIAHDHNFNNKLHNEILNNE